MSFIGALWLLCAKEWSSLAIQSTRTFVRWDSPAVSYDHIHYYYLLHYRYLLQSLYSSPVSIQSTHLFLTQASLIKCLTLQVALETTSLFNLYYIMRLHFATQFLSLRTFTPKHPGGALPLPILIQMGMTPHRWDFPESSPSTVRHNGWAVEAEGTILDIQCHQSPDIFGVNFSIIKKRLPLGAEFPHRDQGARAWATCLDWCK